MNRFFLVVALAALTACNGCQRRAAQVAQPEAPTLPVSQPVEKDVSDDVYFTGQTKAMQSVTLQPRVTGYLLATLFREGADVKTGDLLFEIDPRPYQAQLKAAEAALSLNEASLTYAKETNLRFKELDKKQKGAVSPRELDQYKALEAQAIANLDLAKANLESAKLNLEWTKVVSPLDGRISRFFLTPGNLVNQDVTQLTTIVSMDPMFVYFDMDETTLLRIKRAINEGIITPPRESGHAILYFASNTLGLLSLPLGDAPLLAAATMFPGRISVDAPVHMALGGEEGFPHHGSINFIDNQVNPGTGSVLVRGVFKNFRPRGGAYPMAPGMFVRVKMPIGQEQPRLLVIDRAVTSDQGRKYVYVLGADDKVQQKSVEVGALQEDGLRVILKGLAKTDWVLIGGLQQVRPHMKIQPDRVSMPSLVTPATPQGDPGKIGKAAKGKR